MWYTRISKFWLNFLLPGLVAVLVSGCVTVSQHWNPLDYTVKSGDTLYSIAWRYEKDFQDIARWNNISAPYAIYPGQRLVMVPDNADGTSDHADPEAIANDGVPEPMIGAAVGDPVEVTSPVVQSPPARPSSIVVAKGDTLYSLARDHDLKVAQIARWNFLRHPYRIKPGQTLRLHPPSVPGSKTEPDKVSVSVGGIQAQPEPITVVPKSQTATPVLPSAVSQWHWPVSGRLVKTFDQRDTDRKGIGIAGSTGQAIKAAADGQVVYSGNGLISYGNLVIIKHSSDFLSAYAYNRRLLVKEGEYVKAGQVIANMGTTDSNRAMLHFEIRKNGKPVNPLRYLPRTRG